MFGINTIFSSSFVSSAVSRATVSTTGSPVEISDNGLYRVYTFKSTTETNYSMTFSNVSAPISLSYLAVAGGGGGGGSVGGGGGAGGMVETTYTVLSNQSISIRVGAGGPAPNNGIQTTIGTITAVGGGGGGLNEANGNEGGSGGGGGKGAGTGSATSGGAGTPGQGFGGGFGAANGGGGGGAGGVGSNSSSGGGGGPGKNPEPLLCPGIPTTTEYTRGGQGASGTLADGRPNTGDGGSYERSGGSGIVIIAILKASIV